ncbi:VOC family protein [Nocardia beijingensis]|uniref:VOC family protein n=1 Tax=Nocardia beijingensis TaxID=95162 RepID=UPI0018960073|nr:VOC family protein [Nocardia beijingensis]MBF6465347.1 VOC family protein [Nocardia beijingensis]
MTLSIAHVTIDCENAGALAEFWSQLLETPVDPDPTPEFATVGRAAGAAPVLMFTRVPDKNPGKNVIHLDLHASGRDEVARAIDLGAKHVADYDEWGLRWTTLADPEGNLFDIESE